MHKKNKLFNAIILAGDRGQSDPLLQRFNVPAKAFIKVDGTPMIARVTVALADSGFIKRIFLCGQNRHLFTQIEPVHELLKDNKLVWVQSEKGPSLSAYKALKVSLRECPVVLTTCDHALLTKRHVQCFCYRTINIDSDIAIALARLETIKNRFPEIRRTFYRFRDGSYCSCNLFAFMNNRALRAVQFWKNVESWRKRPLKIIQAFGWTWALRYLFGQLTLQKALKRASHVVGCSLSAVTMDFPEIAIDVDTYEDWLFVERLLTDIKDLPSFDHTNKP